MSKLNLRTMAVLATLSFQLRDASDEPLFNDDKTPCMVTVYGPGSKEYIAAQQVKANRLMEKALKGKEVKLSAKEQAAGQVEFLVAITKEMDVGYVDDSGRDLQGEEKLRAIYSDSTIGFIAEQVTAKVSDWGNFTSGSKKS